MTADLRDPNKSEQETGINRRSRRIVTSFHLAFMIIMVSLFSPTIIELFHLHTLSAARSAVFLLLIMLVGLTVSIHTALRTWKEDE